MRVEDWEPAPDFMNKQEVAVLLLYYLVVFVNCWSSVLRYLEEKEACIQTTIAGVHCFILLHLSAGITQTGASAVQQASHQHTHKHHSGTTLNTLADARSTKSVVSQVSETVNNSCT